MGIEGLTPFVFEEFGGVQTLPDPQDVELGNATDSSNVEYRLGTSVSSRPGRSLFLTVPGAARILSMEEFALLDGATRRLMVVTSEGKLWKENGDLTLSLVEAGLGITTRISQQTMFGRQYMAFSDGKLGNAPPRYYDDVSFARVSQAGPGAAPTATDGAAGKTDAGRRFIRIIFEFGDSSRSAPGPAVEYNGPGSVAIVVSSIPKGPSNVVRRIICSSPVVASTIQPDGASYFFIPNSTMVVNDNTTTGPVSIDFSDAELSAAEDVTNSLFQFVLPEQAGVIAFHDRLVWWGGQNDEYRVADDGLLNKDFDGGFYSNAFGNVPNGWTAFFGGCDVVSPVGGATGAVFRIVADGVNQRGTIQNNVFGMGLNSLIQPNRAYGGRLRARRSPGLTQGSVSLYFLSSGSVVVGGGGGLTIPFEQLSTEWKDFSGLIYPATPTLPVDLVFKLSGGKGADGFTTVLAPAGQYIEVDFCGLYPINQPFTPSLLYLSKPGQPAVYDENGLISVAENNGQAVRRCFVIRNHIFICKEQSIHVATDNGDDPIGWTVSEVSNTVGTPSINGVGIGEGWAVIAARSGFYFFDGGFPQKLSEEIQPTWDRINWDQGHKIVVAVDSEQKRIFIQVPFDGATEISRTLYCDYVGSSPLEKHNWSPDWTSPASSMALSRRPDGALALLFGTQDDTGRILRLEREPGLDAGDPVPSFYRTAFIGGPSGRSSFQYLTATVKGVGELAMTAILPDGSRQALPPVDLRDEFTGDVEWSGLRINSERIALEFGVSQPGDWFSMRKLVAYGRPHPWSRVRGTRS